MDVRGDRVKARQDRPDRVDLCPSADGGLDEAAWRPAAVPGLLLQAARSTDSEPMKTPDSARPAIPPADFGTLILSTFFIRLFSASKAAALL